MRAALVVLLVVHGLIHLIGVSRAGGVAAAMPWLAACAILVAAAVLLLARSGSWWIVAAAGVVVSQVLVIGTWSEAKLGTIPNVIVAAAIVVAWADARFQRESDAAVRALFARAPAGPRPVVTAEELATLPPPVARWLEGAGVVGRPRVGSVRLHQRGRLRTAPDQPFMPVDAEQYITLDEPGFVWRARVRMKRVLPVLGRDAYREGRGRMTIAALGLVEVADARGDAIDQGTLVRFLAEMIWYPSAALAPYITWEPVDDASARATMEHRGVRGSAVFTFDPAGRVQSVRARRFMHAGDRADLVDWGCTTRAWGVRDGLVMPVEGMVAWYLPAGPFEDFAWEVVDLEYDRPSLYGEAAPPRAAAAPIPRYAPAAR